MSHIYAYRQEAVTSPDNKYKVLTEWMLKTPFQLTVIQKLNQAQLGDIFDNNIDTRSKLCAYTQVPDICCLFILHTEKLNVFDTYILFGLHQELDYPFLSLPSLGYLFFHFGTDRNARNVTFQGKCFC